MHRSFYFYEPQLPHLSLGSGLWKGFNGTCTKALYTSQSLKQLYGHYNYILSGFVQSPGPGFWSWLLHRKLCLWASVWLLLTSAVSWVKLVISSVPHSSSNISGSGPAHSSTANIWETRTMRPVRIQMHVNTRVLGWHPSGRVSGASVCALTIDRGKQGLMEQWVWVSIIITDDTDHCLANTMNGQKEKKKI